jgi:4a-hydroxytetrahydrobiopterin dehydratase
MAIALTPDQIAEHLSRLPGWTINDRGELTHKFPQANFMAGLLFVNRIAGLAEAVGHHPDVLLTYPAVTISLTTHDAGGLTVKDFDLAAQIGRLI